MYEHVLPDANLPDTIINDMKSKNHDAREINSDPPGIFDRG